MPKLVIRLTPIMNRGNVSLDPDAELAQDRGE